MISNSTLRIVSLILISLVVSCNERDEQLSMHKGLIEKNGLLYSDSSSSTPFTGKYVSVFKDKKIEFDVRAGVKDGSFKLYFENGKLEIEGTLKNNKNNGEWKYYFPEGMLQSKGEFKNDTLIGKWSWFFKNGKVSETGSFVNGLREGEWVTFDSNGVNQITRIYKQGIVADSIKQKVK